MSKPTIHVTTVINQLKSGVTRTKADKLYNPQVGSIEEIYGLTPPQVKLLFENEKLKGIRTVPYVESPFTLVDDTEQEVVPDSPVVAQEAELPEVEEEIAVETEEEAVTSNNNNSIF